jgi:uncharacterized membrane protein YphA (DoxX/SURF4 family)
MFYSLLIVFTSAFFAILFLQSGLDKIINRKENIEFQTQQFQNSPLKNFTLPLFFTLTIMEVSCGISSVIGIILFLFNSDTKFSLYADTLVSFTFISLFFGLRMSKDYKGAAGIVPYFILSLLGIYFILK